MKIIFTSPNLIEVTQLKDLLERAGIPTVVGNENSGYLTFIPGTGPELWIQDDDDLGEAMEIKADWLVSRKNSQNQSSWVCPMCGETIEAQKAECWRCGTEKPQPGQQN